MDFKHWVLVETELRAAVSRKSDEGGKDLRYSLT